MTKITVGLVTTPLSSGHALRGIGMYTKYLLENLQKLPAKDLEVVTIVDPSIPSSRPLSLLHYPFFDLFDPSLKIIGALPTVVTIHDLTPLRFPEHYPPGLRGNLKFLRQKMALSKVAAIITDSNASKKDIVDFLHFPADKIFVIPLASQISSFPSKKSPALKYVIDKYHLPQEFVLFVGDVNWNKNIPALVNACQMVNIPLVIAGKQAAEIDQLLDNSPDVTRPKDLIRKVLNLPHPQLSHLGKLEKLFQSPSVLRLGFVPSEELAVLYVLATLYCQPSFWEGFGMSCVEAAAAGCPVVVSKIPPFTELLGDSAVYVDPEDLSSIAAGIKKAETPSLRNKLSKMVKLRSKKYSWSKLADETLAVYRSVAR